MSEDQRISVEFNFPPVLYKLDVKKDEVDKALAQLQTFANKNNKKILEVAINLSKLDRELETS